MWIDTGADFAPAGILPAERFNFLELRQNGILKAIKGVMPPPPDHDDHLHYMTVRAYKHTFFSKEHCMVHSEKPS